jgi:uncharacterized protein (TIGR04222 family)
MNPFDLSGPEFLGLYGILLFLTLVVAVCLRRGLRASGDEAPELASQLDPYDIAYLAGKEERAVNAAMANLIHKEVLKANTAERKIEVRDLFAKPEHRLERAVYVAAHGEGGKPIKDVREEVNAVAARPAERLKAMGLLVDDATAWAVRFWPTFLVLLLAGFAAVKIAVGLSRGKPVLFLALALAATVAVALVGFARRPHRSIRGDQLLEQLKEEHAALEYTASRQPAGLAGTDLPLAMGLFGMGVLAAGPLADLRTALKPPVTSGGCGGGCASGCGGGGGGCGGGGCGGGGCGGCGG